MHLDYLLYQHTGTMASTPSILQLQTRAATGTEPIRIVQGSSSGKSHDNSSTASSSASASPKSSLDIVRCSRCQRSLTIDPSLPMRQSGAVRFGMNSYYCKRCANVVGFVK
ncbi:hypothetical protein HRR83_008327 [Exophiala dermatitidis]|uniref:Uncharacterized protein n=1 Tax=Exophiala dermatitidis TaxID=5970 RepID=A0AAN6EPG2_EXODE|nr:hypothetical protein HRR73_007882 [Exophiala dermatitidis]KAJ4507657.1 hypothetical protein HRR74_007984 [Exophiala dermatitidis]KAJ4533040.1 hypothetical protein HRR76_008011 [Exophiala dermatitidis]KAJ4535226.1 hypothetical protein HRR77_008137 [Exophiala dermatitidis]KAJ4560679.1 hypothetical protein HRR79_007801 [Exophiala dermatitidis]